RRVGLIAERLANLTDAEVQSLLEVHERVSAPDVLADLIPCQHVTATSDQQLENLEGLRRQLHGIPFQPQLARDRAQLERAEAKNRPAPHPNLISISVRVNGGAPRRQL